MAQSRRTSSAISTPAISSERGRPVHSVSRHPSRAPQRAPLATSPQLEGIGGRYFEDCNEAPVVEPDSAASLAAGVASYALDPANAERLWELSLATLS